MMDHNDILPSQPVSGEYGYSSNPSDYNSVTTMSHFPNNSLQQMNPAHSYEYNPNVHDNNFYSPDVNQAYQPMNQDTNNYNIMSYDNYHQKDISDSSANPYLISNTSYNSANAMEVEPNFDQTHCMSANYPDVNNVTHIGQSVLAPMSNYFQSDAPHIINEHPQVPAHVLNVNSAVPVNEEFNVPQSSHSEQFHYEPVSDQDSVRVGPQEANMYEAVPISTPISDPSKENVQSINIGTVLKEERSQDPIEDPKENRSEQVPLPIFVKEENTQQIEVKNKNELNVAEASEELVKTDPEPIVTVEHVTPDVKSEAVKSYSAAQTAALIEPSQNIGENDEVTDSVNGNTDELDNGTQKVQVCIRSGCRNIAVNNPEWEQEFCSNECVVTHCRNVFNAWKKANEMTTS